MDASYDPKFPCAIELHVPFPTARLATVALKALGVDRELSALVQREMSVVAANDDGSTTPDEARVLKIRYQATTNRMLRVAVNSFMDWLKLVLDVMEKLDTDLLDFEVDAVQPIPTQ